MTTKTDDQHLAFHAWLSRRGIASNYQGDGQYEEPRVQLAWEAWTTAANEMRPRAAVEADRQNHLADVRKMVGSEMERTTPSDDDILRLWQDTTAEYGLEGFAVGFHVRFARALLSRYGSGQPAASKVSR